MVTEKYKALIEIFPLVPVKDDRHLDEAHAVVQALIARDEPLAPDESEYLEVLLDEIGKYEKKYHALKYQQLSPLELLHSFMHDHKLKQVDLAKILNVSSGVISEIVNGKRKLTTDHCVKLGQHFKVDAGLFLPKEVCA